MNGRELCRNVPEQEPLVIYIRSAQVKTLNNTIDRCIYIESSVIESPLHTIIWICISTCWWWRTSLYGVLSCCISVEPWKIVLHVIIYVVYLSFLIHVPIDGISCTPISIFSKEFIAICIFIPNIKTTWISVRLSVISRYISTDNAVSNRRSSVSLSWTNLNVCRCFDVVCTLLNAIPVFTFITYSRDSLVSLSCIPCTIAHCPLVIE